LSDPASETSRHEITNTTAVPRINLPVQRTTPMNETDYRADALARGFAEPVAKSWSAGHSTDTHAHDKSAYLLITEGTARLGVETAAGMVSTNLGPGSTIEVPAGCRHFEQAGDAPVKFLAALK
jgi:mannose-6-phosphate isomerase-like protein (cupin superfamily)